MVLLPLPDAPTMAQLVPAGTRSDTPCRTQHSGMCSMWHVAWGRPRHEANQHPAKRPAVQNTAA